METSHPSLISQIIEGLDLQVSDLSNFSTEMQNSLDIILDLLKRDKKRLKNLSSHRKIQDKEEKAKIILELIDSFYDVNKKLQTLATNWHLELENLGINGLHLEHSLRYLYKKLPENK